jgi:uncharacterized membrane protein required for colicin V production
MSKSDEEAIGVVALFLIAVAIIAFVWWLIGSTIQFLSNNLFIYGLLVGLVIGIGCTTMVWLLINWWRRRKQE